MANGSWSYIKVDPFPQQVVSECVLGHCCSIVAAQAGHSLFPPAQYIIKLPSASLLAICCDELMNRTQIHLESDKAVMLHQDRPSDHTQSVDVPITTKNKQFP